MARRTQITLTEAQYARLQDLSRETGRSMSELIRRALDRSYGAHGLEAVGESFGSWGNREFDGAEYVDGIRSGLAGRLRRVDGRAR